MSVFAGQGGKPVATPDELGGKLSPEHALVERKMGRRVDRASPCADVGPG
jgi:hypothetical protein